MAYSVNPFTGEVEFNGSGGGGGGGGSDIVVTKYTTPGTYTWTKNANTQFLLLMGWGGGAGGGGGGTADPTAACYGGGGGTGAGGFYYQTYAAVVSSNVTVSIGEGGAGGVGATGVDEKGEDGSFGGVTSFGNITTFDETIFPAYPVSQGSNGKGGGPENNDTGSNSQFIITNIGYTSPLMKGGSSGGFGSPSQVPSSFPSGVSFGAPGFSYGGFITNIGGGGGGGFSSSTLDNGSSGGSYLDPRDGDVILSGGLFVGGQDGSDGLAGGGTLTGGLILSGTGGAGGSASITGNGFNGGNGGSYGAGGGGGGAGINGFSGGNGGNGGDGALIVIEFLKSVPESGIPMNVAEATGDYTVNSDDDVIYVNSATPNTVEFPDLSITSIEDGKKWTVKDTSFAANINPITLSTANVSNLIDGATTQVINQPGGSLTVRKFNTNYYLE